MNLTLRNSSRVFSLILLITVVACAFSIPFVAAQQSHSELQEPSTVGSSETGAHDRLLAIRSIGTETTSLSVGSQAGSINITVTDSSNGQDSVTVPLTVDTTAPDEVPAAVSDDVTAQQWSTIVGDDNDPQATELSAALRSWADTGTYDGADYEATDLSAVIRYWASR